MIKFALASLLAVLAIGSASAQYNVPNAFRAILPPVEFDHPYKGKLTVHIMRDDAAIQAACAPLPRLPGRTGCATRFADSCVIHIRSDKDLRAMNWAPEIIMRHEIGHCNGWGADHKGARRIPPLEIEKYY